MKRIVPIIVTDDRVTSVTVAQHHETGWSSAPYAVPTDDQLRHDLDEVTNSTLGALGRQDEFEGGLGHDGLALRDMALRLRAAFQLDEDDA